MSDAYLNARSRARVREQADALRAAAEAAEAERDTYKAQAEYERQARITALNFPRNRHGYIPCERCGMDCGMDAIVADDLWEAISPVPEYPQAGMLCLWCMDEVAAECGVTGDVRIYFKGRALQSAEAERARLREAEEGKHD